MTQFFPVCEFGDIVINVDNTISCTTGWEIREVAFSMSEISPEDMATIMAATLAYFIAAFAFKQLYKWIFAFTSSDN